MIIGIDASHANKTQRTGVEEYCFQMIQEFKKIIPGDVRVILYSNTLLLPELAEIPPNWETKILFWPFKKLWSQTRLAYELFKNPVDIYFSPGQLLPWLTPKKSAVMVHDSAFEACPGAYRFFGRQYLKWMNRLIVKKAKIIFTSTEFNKNELQRYYGRTEDIFVIPLAYNKNIFFNAGDAVNEFGEYILSVGRLEEKKNTRRLIAAFDKIKNNHPNLKLVLIGSPGTGYSAVRAAIDFSPYKKDMVELGFVKPVALLKYLRGAKIFVFPSLYEGFGIPILEALACGVPVLTSDLPSLKEVGGVACVYADPFNIEDITAKISLLLTDEELRKNKITLGLEHVQAYSWNKTAAQTWQQLNSVAKKS